MHNLFKVPTGAKPRKRVKREEAYLVFKVLFLQVLNISDHLMNDWIKHRLEQKTDESSSFFTDTELSSALLTYDGISQ